ncbi:serine aminopeptidase domain-containing protein [Maricaulis sp.]|uniref:alpha/beta hydrolase family protein n=1 Tax=Maricaulis sp. TaxID=1486257 RepID=UPI002B26886F|nr:alpha/beta hydrolase [Maricaulis sp.]
MMTLLHEEEIRFDARDGYSLSGRIIAPDNPSAAVLISSGTGFPKGLYRRLALAGAEAGFACLIYDYRGIGGSAPKQMRGFKADIVDWGRLDHAAALDRAAALAPGQPLYTIGHSVGGHLTGFADNATAPLAHAFITVGTGYWGAHEVSYRPSALLFWLLYGPACLALTGHIPAGGVWGGTALPRDVFLQWRQWASKPDYFGHYLDQLTPHHFDAVTAPIRSWSFSDDRLCARRSAEDLLKLYPNAATEHRRLAPADIGAHRVDHHGAFKKDAAAFWPWIFNWFDQVSASASR